MKTWKPLMFLVAVLALVSVACSFGSTAAATPTKSAAPAQQQPSSSGLVQQVVLATSTEGEEKNPVGANTVFGTNDTIHAVVQIKDAPANSTFEARWYVVDVGSAASPGQQIDKYSLQTEGSRNLDFTLAPTNAWPVGTYKVEIYVNGALDQTVQYSIK